jgi:hypothetical protein
MGTGTNGQEWAIVGGTGEFTQAQGVIYHKLSRSIKSGDFVHELDVHAFYTPMKRQKVRNTIHSDAPVIICSRTIHILAIDLKSNYVLHYCIIYICTGFW